MDRATWLKLGLLVAVLAALALGARALGLIQHLTPDGLRALAAGSGLYGMLVFVAAFTGGTLIQVPGLVFVGAVIAVTANFAVVRAVGGRAFTTSRNRFLQRMLSRLDRHPVLTIAALRTVLLVSPPLNAALALSGVSLRTYLAGSALGLVLPTLVVCTGVGFFV
jgi:uncharacterized membrane protein YdjX (TVP38/TMEM64 family)